MKLSNLQNVFNNLNIMQSAYSLEDGLADEAYCILNEHEKWTVYYSERGQRAGEKTFSTEEEACEYLLQVLKNDPTVFKNNL